MMWTDWSKWLRFGFLAFISQPALIILIMTCRTTFFVIDLCISYACHLQIIILVNLIVIWTSWYFLMVGRFFQACLNKLPNEMHCIWQAWRCSDSICFEKSISHFCVEIWFYSGYMAVRVVVICINCKVHHSLLCLVCFHHMQISECSSNCFSWPWITAPKS